MPCTPASLSRLEPLTYTERVSPGAAEALPTRRKALAAHAVEIRFTSSAAAHNSAAARRDARFALMEQPPYSVKEPMMPLAYCKMVSTSTASSVLLPFRSARANCSASRFSRSLLACSTISASSTLI